MPIIDTIIQVIKEQKAVLIGIILFCVILGTLIGFMKKREIRIVELDPKQIYRESVLRKVGGQKAENQNYNERIDKALESGENYPSAQPGKESIDNKKNEPEPYQSKGFPKESFNEDSKKDSDFLENEKMIEQNIDKALDKNSEKSHRFEKNKEKKQPKSDKKASQQKDLNKNPDKKESIEPSKIQGQKNAPEEKPLSNEEKKALLNLKKTPQKNKIEVFSEKNQ